MKYIKAIIACLILFIVCFSLFWQVLISSENMFLTGDTLSARSINQGIETSEYNNNEYPYWMPWILGGLPSTHSLQNISDYYFPHYFISSIKGTSIPWFWNYFFHFIFCGIGMYLLLRRLNFNLRNKKSKHQ